MKTFLRIALFFLALTAVSCRAAGESNNIYSSLIDQADVIFVGRVDYISAANVEAQQQIALTVNEVLSDSINIGSGVVLTLDHSVIIEEEGVQTAIPIAELTIGEEIIVFANQEILKTDSGQTAVLTPISSDKGLFVAVEAKELILNQVAQ